MIGLGAGGCAYGLGIVGRLRSTAPGLRVLVPIAIGVA